MPDFRRGPPDGSEQIFHRHGAKVLAESGAYDAVTEMSGKANARSTGDTVTKETLVVGRRDRGTAAATAEGERQRREANENCSDPTRVCGASIPTRGRRWHRATARAG